jgi:IS5 family transposase
MDKIYASKTGRPSYPLLTLLRSLLLGIWYKLSDEQLASSLARDLLFRRFCRLELSSDIPDATTLGRFRQQLVEYDLWEKLLGEVNRQFEEKHIIMSEGRINIIDATPVEAAQSGPDNGVDGGPRQGR